MTLKDEQQIIKSFLERGYQIDRSAMNLLNQDPKTTNKILDAFTKNPPITTTLTDSDLKNILGGSASKIEIVKEPEGFEGPATAEGVLNHLHLRYASLKSLLQKRSELENLTSINKCGQAERFSLIVMVREINRESKKITADDKTGTAQIYLKTNDDLKYLALDETIGILCQREAEAITAIKIFYPDVAIKKEIGKTHNDTTCVFLSGFQADEDQLYENYRKWAGELDGTNTYIFILDDIYKNPKAKELLSCLPKNAVKIILGSASQNFADGCISVGDPATIKIEDVVLFLSSGGFLVEYEKMFCSDAESTIVNLVKKRHLNPTIDIKKPIYRNDPYLLDTTPDIIALGSIGSPKLVNYKGITILANGNFKTQPIFWKMNLRTRETIKIGFT